MVISKSSEIEFLASQETQTSNGLLRIRNDSLRANAGQIRAYLSSPRLDFLSASFAGMLRLAPLGRVTSISS